MAGIAKAKGRLRLARRLQWSLPIKLQRGKIYVGNLGDSRAVLARKPGPDSDLGKDKLEAFEMSIDMKPDV